jgi:hypothetical protein
MGFGLYLLPLGLGLALLGAALGLRLSAARKRGALDVAAGLEVLRTLRWKEFSQYVTQSFEARGYSAETGQRRPGEDGVDIVLTRNAERTLLQVKHGGSYLVGAAPVRALAGLLGTQQAQAGVIATSGAFDAAAAEAAREAPVTLLAGEPLWNSVRGLLPESLVREADERADDAARKAQSKLNVIALAGGGLVLLGALLGLLAALEGGDAPTSASSAVDAPAPEPTAASPGTPAAPRATPAAPAREPTEAELAQQRDFAAAEALLVSGVASASWASNSTLSVALRGPMDDPRRTEVLDEVCKRITAREALRFTRLQVQMLGAGDDAPARWYPCR